MEMFSDVSTRDELAEFLGIPIKKLTYILYVKKPDSYYHTFEIPKKSGGVRQIKSPQGDLKDVQKKILVALRNHRNLVKGYCKCNISHAFEKDKGIVTNAQIHRNKRFVINLDLENFFDSFHFGRVCGYFQKNENFKLSYEVAVALAQLLCYNGTLPQGAATSPIMTNLICEILDIQLLKVAKKFRLDYTRYADDLTFSTNDTRFLESYDDFLEDLNKQIKHAGFKVNDKKTRIQYRDSQQKVTGLVVNQKIQVPRSFYKETRAMAYRLYTTGEFEIDSEPGTQKQLEGRFSFIDQLCKYNNKLDYKLCNKKHNCFTLNNREKQYQMFLFYKYFFSNDCPLIITEGQTDIVYLRAALKNMYTDYPELITRKSDGEFEYKISFLNRTDRLAYFFNYSTNGADAMGNLYLVLSDFYKPFCKMCGRNASFPVLFVFDNEIYNKEKPLYKFLNKVKYMDKKDKISSELGIKLANDTNIFLITHQLVNGQRECEIEDLFDQAVLDVEIKGKRFSRDKDFDKSLYFGKEIFSRHIASNYVDINFSRFRPMLDKIKEIITGYEN